MLRVGKDEGLRFRKGEFILGKRAGLMLGKGVM
jgi:hypothetical protein